MEKFLNDSQETIWIGSEPRFEMALKLKWKNKTKGFPANTDKVCIRQTY